MGDPDLFDTDGFKAILEKNQMGVSLLNTGNINYAFGLSLVNADPEKEKQAFEKFTRIIDIAAKLGCYVQAGVSRGFAIPGKPYPYFKAKLVEVYKDLCDYAAAKNVELLLEYTNRFEINTVNNFAEARDIIERVNKPNMHLLLDTYHSYLEDPDVYETIYNAKDYVKVFHFHDSDRGPAGASNGVLDFEKIFRILYDIKFSGFLSDGLLTTAIPEEQVKRSTSFLREMINAYRL